MHLPKIVFPTTLNHLPTLNLRQSMNSTMAAATQHDTHRSSKRVAVVGAGVSGLAAAHKLTLNGFKVMIFESEGRAGGKLKSICHDGLTYDLGANTMTGGDMEVRSLIDILGLQEKQQFPISQEKRYIVKNGLPELIPSNPISLIKSNALSARSKLNILLEPFLWKKRCNISNITTNQEESVGGFFQRHFGNEVVDYLVDPFLAGSTAGDPGSICMLYAFPELWNLEKRFGSIIVGAIKSKLLSRRAENGEALTSSGKNKHQRGSFSFLGGMQTLTDAICEELGKDALKLQSRVLSLSYSPDEKSASQNWYVSVAHGKQSLDTPFDAVIMTAPLKNVKEMIITHGGNPFPLDFIPKVDYLPLSVVITAFKKENVNRPLEGFGILVPSKEQQSGLKTLGTLFSSMMFPDRAPSDSYLYTTFVGGSRNRELAKASNDELKRLVSSDLRQLLGAKGDPAYFNHFYWSNAFPLYDSNYGSVLETIKTMEDNLPGFFYAGNHKGGLSVGKAIASGSKAADLVTCYLDK